MSYPIIGIQAGRGPAGELPIRREIDEWWFSEDPNDINQRSLFIYALHNFQKRGFDKNDDLSYLDIAGIHGLPRLPWPRKSHVNPHVTPGFYCAHGKVTFPTWHTPYMLLYEQRIYEEMRVLIPKTFAERDEEDMIKAADTWRLPFWDWAMKKPNWNPKNPDDTVNRIPGCGPNVPFIITQEKVAVRTSTGAALVDNPMFHFALPRGSSFGKYGVANDEHPWWALCRVTSRRPSLPEDLGAKEWGKLSIKQKHAYTEGHNQDWRKITKQLQGSVDGKIGKEHVKYYANTLPEAVSRLFRSADEHGNPVMQYSEFATGTFRHGQAPERYPSLEAIHNNIHNFSGGSGYLGSPPTSAYDPLFWLHHCNVDRLLAIWQDLYSAQTKAWLKTGRDRSARPETKLEPFSSDTKGSLYTSVTCSFQHQKFGYTYPELQRWRYTDDNKYLAHIRTDIHRLYSSTSKAALLLDPEAAKVQMAAMTAENLKLENFPPRLLKYVDTEVADNAQAPLRRTFDHAFGKPAPASWKSNDYVANVVYEVFALGGRPYSITFFLGDVPDHSSYDFADDLTAIGRVYNFSSEVEGRGIDDSGCQSCKLHQEEGAQTSGQVILTDYLIERIIQGQQWRGLTLKSLNEDEVVKYLKKNLHWRITDVYHNLILKENLPSLKISVAKAVGTFFSDPSKPSHFSEYKVLWHVTLGRLGGAAPEDLGLPGP